MNLDRPIDRRPLEGRAEDLPQGGSPPMPGAVRVVGAVLCGGRSERMGRDKALLRVGGRTLLEKAVDAVGPVADEVVLACGPVPRYGELGLALAVDPAAGIGPLAGIAAGLETSAERGAEWLVLVPCDVPDIDAALMGSMLERAREEEADLCVLEGPSGIEPLCAVLRRTCAPAVREAIAAGHRKANAFWSDPAQKLRVVRFALPPSTPDPTRNLNRPEDYEAYARGPERGAGVTN